MTARGFGVTHAGDAGDGRGLRSFFQYRDGAGAARTG